MDHGGSRYHGDDRQGVPLTDGIIATSDALKRKEGEHEQMLVPDERRHRGTRARSILLNEAIMTSA